MSLDRVSFPDETLNTMIDQIDAHMKTYHAISESDRDIFLRRLRHYAPVAAQHFCALYGVSDKSAVEFTKTLSAIVDLYADRPTDLKQLDRRREKEPNWFQSQTVVGAVCYVDRFADNLAGLRARSPYLHELGITYLHLMPLYKSPEPENDGGYAVSDFRTVKPSLGTMAQLSDLAAELRAQGIILVLDIVFNHTADDHPWAQAALAGDPVYQAYYWLFPDRSLPDQYQVHLREIFPDQAPGSFTYQPTINRWVWTTFHPYQWDLNYSNPAVFRAMLCEMIFLANQGAQVLRLDAVPFIWKVIGTPCENLPQTHDILRAFNALVRIVCPALLFKSEAIVHPRDVRSYIAPEECQLSYNPIAMVGFWEALATGDARFFTHAMRKQFALPDGTSWINYLRSHDDIGWGFADEDATELGIDGADHRHFLNLFYTGRYPGSFARGLQFNYNPLNNDRRISGTLASLAGLEEAVASNDTAQINMAIARIVMLYSLILSLGGIPLIYLGDELGTLNDYSYESDPAKAHDNRWVHRPVMNAERYARRLKQQTIEGRIFTTLCERIALRTALPAFANGETYFLQPPTQHTIAFVRNHEMLILANLSADSQYLDRNRLQANAALHLRRDRLTGTLLEGEVITLPSYGVCWLAID